MITKGYANTSLGQVHYLSTIPSNEPTGANNNLLPTLVLLHQTPSSSEMFRALMTELADDFYCIAPDFIGFGNSDAVPKNKKHSIQIYAQSVAECLEALAIKSVYVFGHHTGVSVATQLETDYPSTCEKLIFSGPTLLTDELKKNLPSLVVDSTLDEEGLFLTRYWQTIRNKDNTVPIALSLRENILALQLGNNYKKAYQAVAEHDFAEQIKSITCPTLVFAGDRDVLKNFVEQTVELLPQGKKAEIGDASTYVCETHVNKVATLITHFCLERQIKQDIL